MKEHYYTKLKDEYEHTMKRLWDLFEHGRKAENKLRMAVANAYHGFDRINKCDDIKQIKSNSRKLKEFMAACDKEYCELTGDKDITSDELVFVGYTNGFQIMYGAEAEGAFYSTTDNDCWIPLYMMARHAHRLETTSDMQVSLDAVKIAQDANTK